MTQSAAETPFVAIACGGTGGHLFPGLAVAEQLVRRNCAVSLLISPKEVDQQGVRSVKGMNIVTLPAVALQRGSRLAFVRGFWQSWRAARKCFQSRMPDAVLAMGGFTSAPPLLAGRRGGARTFLHESNTIPGRANRWQARFVDQAFIGFPEAADRLHARDITVTGTPVRAEFRPRDPGDCRKALGLDPDRPVVLVTGGSQGASGINEIVLSVLPTLAKLSPHWQWLHLAGPNDVKKVRAAYAETGLSAVVHNFLSEIELALGAATACISRAGASSLAELAAMRMPSLLVPYPSAADNHQLHNAQTFVKTGAARLIEQSDAPVEKVAGVLAELMENAETRASMQSALARLHAPKAAEEIAGIILCAVEKSKADAKRRQHSGCSCASHAKGTTHARIGDLCADKTR